MAWGDQSVGLQPLTGHGLEMVGPVVSTLHASGRLPGDDFEADTIRMLRKKQLPSQMFRWQAQVTTWQEVTGLAVLAAHSPQLTFALRANAVR